MKFKVERNLKALTSPQQDNNEVLQVLSAIEAKIRAQL